MIRVLTLTIVALLAYSTVAEARHGHRQNVRHAKVIDANGNGTSYSAGHRPAGCPHAWCGCGTSLHVFGKIIPSLNLASNWGRFPSAAPGPGMVAYRSGHVKVITGGGPGGYTCYDPNSGGGVAHSGPCSIAGYRIVNPHGGTGYASRGEATSERPTRQSRQRYTRVASYQPSIAYTYIPGLH